MVALPICREVERWKERLRAGATAARGAKRRALEEAELERMACRRPRARRGMMRRDEVRWRSESSRSSDLRVKSGSGKDGLSSAVSASRNGLIAERESELQYDCLDSPR